MLPADDWPEKGFGKGPAGVRVASPSRTASGVIIGFGQGEQVGGKVSRRNRGVGVVFAQDPALAVQDVLVQVAGGLHLA